MIVACPKCESKYNIPDGKIAPTGSKMRCAKCQHVFTAMPPAKDFDTELSGLQAAEAPARPQPAPRPQAPAQKMPWDDDAPAAEAAAPAGPAQKMPWDDDDPPAKSGAGPVGGSGDDEPQAGSAKKMPWDDDEPATGLADDDEPAGRRSGRFDDQSSGGASGQRAGSKDDDFLSSLGTGGDSYGQDKAAGAKSSKKKWIVLVLVLALLGGAGAGLYLYKPWTKMNIPNIPFLSSLTGKAKATADNADKVKDIALRNVRQYYIPNEKAGQIFVVEGKAVNNFATPKERIKVEISLFDEKGHVLVAKQLLCGNTLSQFQLQVQSEEEINSSLASEVGILTSNTFLKTGMDTPFMAVFFKPPDTVKEFGVKVVDALDPK